MKESSHSRGNLSENARRKLKKNGCFEEKKRKSVGRILKEFPNIGKDLLNLLVSGLTPGEELVSSHLMVIEKLKRR